MPKSAMKSVCALLWPQLDVDVNVNVDVNVDVVEAIKCPPQPTIWIGRTSSISLPRYTGLCL